jgi:methionyl-tRNA formyltransferase
LRIVLIGQAAFAAKSLEVLQERGDQIVHVFAPPDSSEGRADPLKTKALELGLPLSQPSSFRSDAAYVQFKSLDADLAIMAFVTLIVPERILYLPRHKSICFHPSLLPRHRGASAIAWTLIHGDSETGVTWFWPDKGIDTGPILIQRRVAVGPNETTRSFHWGSRRYAMRSHWSRREIRPNWCRMGLARPMSRFAAMNTHVSISANRGLRYIT